ncbi:MAG: ATP-dependent DNA helicase RecG [Verrucomicrobiota bacterium]
MAVTPSDKNRDVWTKLGYRSPRELLGHFPRRYEDRSRWQDPFTCPLSEPVTIKGEVLSGKSSRWRGGKAVFEVLLQPEGHLQELSLLWFNMPFLKNVLKEGVTAVLHGSISESKKGRRMIHPEYEVLNKEETTIHLNRVTPIYSSTAGVQQKVIRRLVYDQLFKEDLKVREFYPAPDFLMPRKEAITKIHFPESEEEIELARKRLAFDELFQMQVILAVRRQQVVRLTKERSEPSRELVKTFLEHLRFRPTEAQLRVFQEIDRDLKKPHPMHRLVQGDVGSGKTLIAAHALLRTLESGKNGAFLAPTETLAMQHATNLRQFLEPAGVNVVLWTRSQKPESGSVFDREMTVYVGTHALIQQSAELENLGIGVIDEQHKFGVGQRQALMAKGEHPDLLVMTATPIPRTLCLTYYGDLDVSVLDELPAGRKPVKTVLRARKDLGKVWKFIKKEAERGAQAYVVYPLLEESEKLKARSVKEAHEELVRVFGEDEVVMMHGKLDPDEKKQRMEAFKSGEYTVMVATSVIEVGVDNPKATMMVVENAERFGLAQLHQLRGRVGRGNDQAYCVLIGEPKSEEGWRRLEVMEETSDGFKIAEEDLKIRGPGDLLGTDQSGFFPLKIANLVRDLSMLDRCRQLAETILDEDPELDHHKTLRSKIRPYLKSETPQNSG